MFLSPDALPTITDIAIIGGGPVGALTALRLSQSGHRVLLIEAQKNLSHDPRALALSWSSVNTLKNVNAWSANTAATPIQTVHISQKASMGRTLIHAHECEIDALGYVVAYSTLIKTMHEQLADSPITCISGAKLQKIIELDDTVDLHIETETASSVLTARLVIFADGGGNVEGLETDYYAKDYGHSAIVSTINILDSHQHIAYERFTKEGPLALLPYHDQFALIWSQPTHRAKELLSYDEKSFLHTLQKQFNQRIPTLTGIGPRYSFPLSMKQLKSHPSPHIICIGNAAQTLHPIAGQGLNVGIRDAITLAHLLEHIPKEKLGHPTTYARYQALRNKDRSFMLGFTDLLVEGFSKNWPLISPLRSMGLLLLNQQPFLKKQLVKHMLFGF